jgi:O-antigen ligase
VVAVVTGVLAGLLAFDGGGYFPPSWGWAGAVLAFSAGGLAIFEGARPHGPAERVFAGGLAAFAGWILLSATWSQSAPSSIAEFARALVPAAGALLALGLRRTDAPPLLAGAIGAATAVSVANIVDRIGGSAPGTGGASAPVGYANGLGILAALAILLGVGEALGGARRSYRVAVGLTVPVNVTVLYLSQSTGATGAFLLGVAVAGIAAGGRLRVAGLVAAVALAVAGVAFAGGHERGAYWSVALGSAAEHPLLGTGAGTYWQTWLRERDEPRSTQNAHGLYVETLAEQGPVGLVLIGAALLAPLATGRRARRPLAVGAYAAFLAHAGLDWDWELTGVTLVALLVGASLLLDGRSREPSPRRSPAWVALAAVLGSCALGWLGGAIELERARAALRDGSPEAAGRAELAAHLAPWASEPWLVAAQAHRVAGDRPRAAEAARAGLELDDNDWRLWAALAAGSTGAERERALRRARSLNPLGG